VGLRRGGRGIRLAALLLPALTTTCAGHLPPCPSAGGPAWTELESAHFVLRTDEKPADARAVLIDLEQLQAALLTIFGAPVNLNTGRVPVVVVDRGWTDFAPRQVIGYFTHALFQPLVVMTAGGQLHRQELIKHELVHYLSSKIMLEQPPWLSEGLATYYQTIDYDADAGRITVGKPPEAWLSVAQQAGVTNIESVLRANEIGSGSDSDRFYAVSWVVVHYLMNHRMSALAGYEKALRAGSSREAAWASAFGGQTPAQLALDVRQYMDGGRYALLVYRFPSLTLAAPSERRMSDADVHATRALLFVTGGNLQGFAVEPSLGADGPVAGARRELAEGLRGEPGHVGSLAVAHWLLDAPVDLELARAASRQHAGDWRSWLLLAAALERVRDTMGRDDARARAFAIADSDRSIKIPGPRPDTDE
jgi:hypothetical protein